MTDVTDVLPTTTAEWVAEVSLVLAGLGIVTLTVAGMRDAWRRHGFRPLAWEWVLALWFALLIVGSGLRVWAIEGRVLTDWLQAAFYAVAATWTWVLVGSFWRRRFR